MKKEKAEAGTYVRCYSPDGSKYERFHSDQIPGGWTRSKAEKELKPGKTPEEVKKEKAEIKKEKTESTGPK